MKIKSSSFQNYPFSKLYRDYTAWNDPIRSFFDYNPFESSDYAERCQSIRFNTDREEIVSSLIDYNLQFGAEKSTIDEIKKLKDDGVYTVVTGQQVMLYGGPMFTVYKIITAINTAKRLSEELDKQVIPVFWLADEDHDFEEVSSLSVPFGDEFTDFRLNHDGNASRRVVEQKLNGQLNDLKKKLNETLPDTDFSADLWSVLDRCYKTGETFGNSFGRLVLSLFGKHGLILAGSNHDGIKKLISEPMIRSVSDAANHQETLENTSRLLTQNDYHRQVSIQSSNLFRIEEDGSRIKLQVDGEKWSTNEGDRTWTNRELINEIENEPEKFSPNVFLRPIIQNHLLPVLSYVAGPGEVAYYAQMRDYHQLFDLRMPVITPRLSATLIESSIERMIGKLPFELHDYFERIEDLEKDFLKRSDNPDLESMFKKWKSSVSEVSDDPILKVSEIEPTLRKSADKTVAQFFTELDKLKGKLYRSIKEGEMVQIQRIQRVQNNLYPNRNLQEREVAFMNYLNKYGLELFDELIENLKDEVSDSHKLIYL